MPKVRLSSQARLDIEGLVQYIAHDDAAAAIAQAKRIRATIAKLARFPLLGRARADLGKGVRSFPVGDYVIFYLVCKGHVSISRILHAARDLARHLPIMDPDRPPHIS